MDQAVTPNRPGMRLLWVVPLAIAVYLLGMTLSGALLAATPLEPVQIPQEIPVAWAVVSVALLILGVTPIAVGLSGGVFSRWLVLAVFLYLVHTASTAIETRTFTKLGGQGFSIVFGALPAVAGAAVLSALARVREVAPSLNKVQLSGGLAWRLGVGWLAFPASYLCFGILIAPFAIAAYSREDSFVIPPMGLIVLVQAVRSVLFLLPTLAVIERWSGSRLSLWLVLGWAHWALVGLAGLVIPLDFFGPQMRLIHALEIGATSFLYSGILVTVLPLGGGPTGRSRT